MTMVAENLPFGEPVLAQFCRRYHIRKLAFFGSVVRQDFRPDSDVDVLVEFEPGHVPGLAFFAIQEELSRLLGREVELHTPKFLSRYFRDQVLAEAIVQYEQG
jgi:predicted nucleotidyltransferase